MGRNEEGTIYRKGEKVQIFARKQQGESIH